MSAGLNTHTSRRSSTNRSISRLRVSVLAEFAVREGVKLSFMPFLAKAICETLLEMPEVNATYEEASQANRVKRYVNLGIAAATPRGLLVPNIKDADSMSWPELATALNHLTAIARDGRVVAVQGGAVAGPGLAAEGQVGEQAARIQLGRAGSRPLARSDLSALFGGGSGRRWGLHLARPRSRRPRR